MLTTNELTWMRSMQSAATDATIVIERSTPSSDGTGGFTEVWAAVGTVTGRMAMRIVAAGEPLIGGQPSSTSYWWATLPQGTDVTEKDRLVTDTRSFEVTRVNTSESWQTAVRCECVAYNREKRT